MIKKILLTLLVIVVLFLIFRNVELGTSNQEDNQTEETSSLFLPSPEEFEQKQIDGTASQITWFGENKIQAKSHTGTLRFDETVSFIGLAPRSENGPMKVVGGQLAVDMTTLQGENEPEMLVNHLRSADFFDVETYPQANLLVTASSDVEVKGLLSIKDITQEVTIPYTIEQTGDVYVVRGTLEIDRTLWDITTLSGTFFDDVGDSIVEDIISLDFVVTTK